MGIRQKGVSWWESSLKIIGGAFLFNPPVFKREGSSGSLNPLSALSHPVSVRLIKGKGFPFPQQPRACPRSHLARNCSQSASVQHTQLSAGKAVGWFEAASPSSLRGQSWSQLLKLPYQLLAPYIGFVWGFSPPTQKQEFLFGQNRVVLGKRVPKE